MRRSVTNSLVHIAQKRKSQLKSQQQSQQYELVFTHCDQYYYPQDAEVPIEDLLALYYNTGNERGDDDAHVDTGHVALDDIQPEPLPPYDDHTEEINQNGVHISPRQSPISQDSHPASPLQSSSVNPPENQRITRGCKYVCSNEPFHMIVIIRRF